MWVVQEVYATRTDPLVICGNMSAPWEACSTAILQVSWDELGKSKKDRSLPDPETLVYFTLLRSEAERGKVKLESLLTATCNREASDPRDHVYAHLGLINDAEHFEFQADYSQSPSIAYQNAMISVFKGRGDLDWLVYGARHSMEVPSWCADFSTKTWKTEAIENDWRVNAAENRQRETYGAGASTGKDMSIIAHDSGYGTMTVRGVPIGRVEKQLGFTCGGIRVQQEAKDQLTSAQIDTVLQDTSFQAFKDIGSFIIYGHPALKRRQDLSPDQVIKKMAEGAIWKVAAGGATFEELTRNAAKSQNRSYPNGYAILEKFAQKMHPIRPIMSHDWAHLLPEEPADFTFTAVAALTQIAFGARDGCFLTTDTGYIGRATHMVEEGDTLAILFGSRLPAVLRPQPDGTYKIVTFAYVDDLMHGEYLQNSETEKDFVLC
jgi:hypothetical protein